MATRDRDGVVNDGREREAADRLAGRICAAAALSAQSQAQLLELIGEFDAAGMVGWWSGVKSLAHWLGWACSMSAGTAREHVRVARALRRMPAVQRAFGEGRMSYSKVREVTRMVDLLDDARLCELALTATASQLSRMLAAFRRVDESRIEQQAKRQGRWQYREDGMVDLRLRLPAEEAAVVRAAIAAAEQQFGTPPAAAPTARSADQAADQAADRMPSEQIDRTPGYGTADAVLDLARAFLATAPEDRSGEDRTTVVVQIAAEQLGDVPAGTSGPVSQVATVVGVGSIEPATAARLSCDADLIGAVVDTHGDVLALGRTRRLVSRAQRRALMIRDRMCRFPGCHQTRHLKAHHVRAWSAGGPTDLDNLVLLCQWHHTTVHEGRMSLSRTPDQGSGWTVHWPDGRPLRPWEGGDSLGDHLGAMIRTQSDRHRRQLETVGGFDSPMSRTIRPGWAGERFDKAACVDALFGMRYVTAA